MTDAGSQLTLGCCPQQAPALWTMPQTLITTDSLPDMPSKLSANPPSRSLPSLCPLPQLSSRVPAPSLHQLELALSLHFTDKAAEAQELQAPGAGPHLFLLLRTQYSSSRTVPGPKTPGGRPRSATLHTLARSRLVITSGLSAPLAGRRCWVRELEGGDAEPCGHRLTTR